MWFLPRVHHQMSFRTNYIWDILNTIEPLYMVVPQYVSSDGLFVDFLAIKLYYTGWIDIVSHQSESADVFVITALVCLLIEHLSDKYKYVPSYIY